MKHRFQRVNSSEVLLTRIRYGCIWMVVCVFHLFYQSYFTFYVLLLTTLLPWISLALMLTQRKKLKLELSFSKGETIKGNKEHILIKATGGFFPLAILKFQCNVENVFYENIEVYDIAFLNGFGTWLKEELSCDLCGRMKAEISSYLLLDLLGLWKKKCNCKLATSMLILPAYRQSAQIEEFSKQGMEKEKEIAKRTGFQSDDSYEIREYQNGDSLKRLHHKMTYKLHKPMIRQYANLDQAQIILQLDMSGDQQVVEHTLTMFHSTARIFLKQGTQLKCCYAYQHHSHTVELIQLSSIRQVLSDILSAPREEETIENRESDDIQYRIHGFELIQVEPKEDPYERTTSSL